MIKLPITDKELDTIIEMLKYSKPELYAKLWSHKINFLTKGK
jgi:hypothetical protein